ncbi:hypothetical protein BJ742DRAFT_834779 [Cladochytrium replicatum]|nr:hypothetical protein BJ742DRAFT_834779 [Cladochytrium replicatum]
MSPTYGATQSSRPPSARMSAPPATGPVPNRWASNTSSSRYYPRRASVLSDDGSEMSEDVPLQPDPSHTYAFTSQIRTLMHRFFPYEAISTAGAGEDDLESPPSIASSQPRNAYRKIVADGTAIVILPLLSTSRYNPCVFSLEPPSALNDDSYTRRPSSSMSYTSSASGRASPSLAGLSIVPAPLYRAVAAELNRVCALAYRRRRNMYRVAAAGAMVASIVVLWVSIVAATRGFGWLAAFLIIAAAAAVVTLKPMVENTLFTKILSNSQPECRRIINEWNMRAPPGIRFRVAGGGIVSGDVASGTDPELHVVLLDGYQPPSSKRTSGIVSPTASATPDPWKNFNTPTSPRTPTHTDPLSPLPTGTTDATKAWRSSSPHLLFDYTRATQNGGGAFVIRNDEG